jgi:pimeloyl-ACP methyl ester carboxylesterase
MGTTNKIEMAIRNYPSQTEISLSETGKFKDVQMDNVEITDSSLSFSWTKIGLSFKGKYFSNGDSLIGVLSQMDVKWAANFYRQEQAQIEIIRPQEPKEPFPYSSQEVRIKNGGVTLSGTLTLPNASVLNYPIVVLASGSGPQDRNCEILGHKSFLVIADYLARNGIGCLRFDDRGYGKSTGIFQKATLEDFASDVRACVNFLAKDSRFSANIIGIVGHSEGGMHALIAAKKNKQVDFVVELASVGTSGADVLIEQQYLIPLKIGKSEEYAKWNSTLYAGICAILMDYSMEKSIDPMNDYLREMYKTAPQDYKNQMTEMNFNMALNQFLNNAWGRQFIAFETKDYVRKLKIPLLIINGSEDIQVPAKPSQAAFSLHASKKSKVKVILAEGLNHLFQQCTTCSVLEYGELEETFSTDVLLQMTNWIKEL